jgi:hypothetical protein
VSVHVDFNGRTFTGKAASTDVVDASARAYLHAVNKGLGLARALDAAETAGAGVPRVSDVADDRARAEVQAAPAHASAAKPQSKEDAAGGPVRVAGSEDLIRLIRLV